MNHADENTDSEARTLIHQQDPIMITQRWVKQWVVGLNLCPFARVPLQKGRIRYRLFEGRDEADLLTVLMDECKKLDAAEQNDFETTLIIAPHCGLDFDDYLGILNTAGLLMSDAGWDGTLQVASFHPDYVFEGTAADANENYSNRAPYPIFHLLKEASIDWARQHFDDLEAIPYANIKRLEGMTRAQLLTLFRSVISA